MRLTSTIASTLVLLACFGTPAIAADKSAAVEKEISKIEHEMAAAVLKSDFDVFDRYVAPEYTFTTPDGQVWTWAENLNLLKTGAIKVSAFKFDEVKVKVYGDTAIASLMDTETTTYNGKDISGQYRTTDVFVKRNGKWKVVASHASKVEK